MSEQLESALQIGTFKPFISARPIAAMEQCPGPSLAKPRIKHSLVAFGFLLLYVTIYLAVGFLGISLIGRVWAAVFG
jgi:hypothetical protein